MPPARGLILLSKYSLNSHADGSASSEIPLAADGRTFEYRSANLNLNLNEAPTVGLSNIESPTFENRNKLVPSGSCLLREETPCWHSQVPRIPLILLHILITQVRPVLIDAGTCAAVVVEKNGDG